MVDRGLLANETQYKNCGDLTVSVEKGNIDASGQMPRFVRARGCCSLLHVKEDNARFLLLALVLCCYMITGAAIFMLLEQGNEQRERVEYRKMVDSFTELYPFVNKSLLEELLRQHALAAAAGFVEDIRPRWDFAGAFYFVGTVVSTIGE